MSTWASVGFWTKVGAVCGGILALFALLGTLWFGASAITATAWAYATRPIVAMVGAETAARIDADLRVIAKIDSIQIVVEGLRKRGGK